MWHEKIDGDEPFCRVYPKLFDICRVPNCKVVQGLGATEVEFFFAVIWLLICATSGWLWWDTGTLHVPRQTITRCCGVWGKKTNLQQNQFMNCWRTLFMVVIIDGSGMPEFLLRSRYSCGSSTRMLFLLVRRWWKESGWVIPNVLSVLVWKQENICSLLVQWRGWSGGP